LNNLNNSFQSSIETKRSSQRIPKNSESRNSIAHSEGYAVMNRGRWSSHNKENFSHKAYEQGKYDGENNYMGNSKEVQKLTAQMELLKLNNESLQNEINVS